MPVMNDYEATAAIRSLPDAWEKRTGNIERGFVMTEQKLYQFCDTMAASEYRSLIRPFLDISTLSARLKAEECISTEYRMCDGSWHRMLFTVKKDESGNVTHVCKIREELRRFCIKLKLDKRHVKYDDENNYIKQKEKIKIR